MSSKHQLSAQIYSNVMNDSNPYLTSLVNPWAARPVPIPDNVIAQSVCKRTETSLAYTVPMNGTNSQIVDLMVLIPFHSPYREARVYGKLNGAGRYCFLFSLRQDYDITQDYNKARLVSAGFRAISSTIAAGAFAVNGTINAATYVSPPDVFNATSQSILTQAATDYDKVISSPVAGGVSTLARPSTQPDYWDPIPYVGLSTDQTPVMTADPPPFMWESVEGDVYEGNLGAVAANTPVVLGIRNERGYGWYKISVHIQAQYTAVAGLIQVQLGSRYADQTTFAEVTNFYTMNTGFDNYTTGLEGSLMFTRWVYFPSEFARLQLNFTSAISRSRYSVSCTSYTSMSSWLDQGSIISMVGLTSGQQIAFAGVHNYQTTPNETLIKNLKVSFDMSDDVFDLKIAEFAMAHAQDFGISVVHPMAVYTNMLNGLQARFPTQTALIGHAASVGSVWAKIWNAVKGTVKKVAPLALTGVGTALQTVTGLPFAPLGAALGNLVSNQIGVAEPDGSIVEGLVAQPPAIRRVGRASSCKTGSCGHEEQMHPALRAYLYRLFLSDLGQQIQPHMAALCLHCFANDIANRGWAHVSDAYNVVTRYEEGIEFHLAIRPDDLREDPDLGPYYEWLLAEYQARQVPQRRIGHAATGVAKDDLDDLMDLLDKAAANAPVRPIAPAVAAASTDITKNTTIYKAGALNVVDPVPVSIRAMVAQGLTTIPQQFNPHWYGKDANILHYCTFPYIDYNDRGKLGAVVISKNPLIMRAGVSNEGPVAVEYDLEGGLHWDARLLDRPKTGLTYLTSMAAYYISFIPEEPIDELDGQSWWFAFYASKFGLPTAAIFSGSIMEMTTMIAKKVKVALMTKHRLILLNPVVEESERVRGVLGKEMAYVNALLPNVEPRVLVAQDPSQVPACFLWGLEPTTSTVESIQSAAKQSEVAKAFHAEHGRVARKGEISVPGQSPAVAPLDSYKVYVNGDPQDWTPEVVEIRLNEAMAEFPAANVAKTTKSWPPGVTPKNVLTEYYHKQPVKAANLVAALYSAYLGYKRTQENIKATEAIKGVKGPSVKGKSKNKNTSALQGLMALGEEMGDEEAVDINS